MKSELINKVNDIYNNYEECFHSICDYASYTLYDENNITRYKDDLFLVLTVIRNITPVHDLVNYCRIPKTKEELKILINELGLINYNESKNIELDMSIIKDKEKLITYVSYYLSTLNEEYINEIKQILDALNNNVKLFNKLELED